MIRGGTQRAAAIFAGMLAVVSLTSCGGVADSTGSSSQDVSGPGASKANQQAPEGKQGSEAVSGKAGGGDERTSNPAPRENAGGNAAGAGGSRKVATPLRVSGGGSRQFRTRSPDNSVQEYGGEGSEAELREAAEVVHGFYVARAEGKWAEACGYVSESLKVRMAKAAPALKEVDGTSCVAFLEGFTADLTPAEWREVTTVDAGSLRHEDDRAFLLYYGSEGKAYTMPLLSDEGGEWKVNALAPVALR